MKKRDNENKPVKPQPKISEENDKLTEEDLAQVTGGVAFNETVTNLSRSQSDAQKSITQNLSV